MSLLTQFYDCPSSGGDPTDFSTFKGGIYAGANPYMLFIPLDGQDVSLGTVPGSGTTPNVQSVFQGPNGAVCGAVTWGVLSGSTSGFPCGPYTINGGGNMFTTSALKTLIAVNISVIQNSATATIVSSATCTKVSGGGWVSWGTGGFGFFMPSLITVENAQFANITSTGANYSNLANIETCNFGFSPTTIPGTVSIVITNAKLTVASVEKVLADVRKIKTSQPGATGTVNLSSGTSAGYSALSAQGQADYNYLVGAGGISMTLNA